MRMGMAMKMILSAMVLSVAVAVGETEYTYGEDLVKQDGVPAGKVTKHVWKGSDLFEGTAREYYVYVPAQYDGSEAAALMVFQDGHTCVKEGGDFRVPVVFDNLIAKGEMPVTVAVMVNPGWFVDGLEKAQGWKAPKGVRSNRSVEYDTLSAAYVGLLEKEILPEVEKTVNLSKDPAKRAILPESLRWLWRKD